MKTLSVAQQITNLRPALGIAAQINRWFLGAAVLGAITSLLFWNLLPLTFSLFFVIVGFSRRKLGSNLIAAISAFDEEVPSLGEVCITITRWNADNHYHGIVRETGYPNWKYEFIPQGWRPVPGTYPAKIWRTDIDGRPILTVVQEGIMIPTGDARVESGSIEN
ncbi:hypothetical protein IQE94_14540 [Synechocystis sp. PCC 7339]|uniref:hypothetical protein n=1 Tax=Synechocystis sp. PCC 7339 TaxID=2782213 RepID=UPI001CBE5031|nr:hypothetical protein [Synechocystis sp. PCC 7339]UAJ72281.1 hypothetical protein IQE94_14540 [Synechocystis sp. PCC 7339]